MNAYLQYRNARRQIDSQILLMACISGPIRGWLGTHLAAMAVKRIALSLPIRMLLLFVLERHVLGTRGHTAAPSCRVGQVAAVAAALRRCWPRWRRWNGPAATAVPLLNMQER